MNDTPIMDAEYYADIELPETVARNVYTAGQRLERDRAKLIGALRACIVAFSVMTPSPQDYQCVSDAANLLKELDASSGEPK